MSIIKIDITFFIIMMAISLYLIVNYYREIDEKKDKDRYRMINCLPIVIAFFVMLVIIVFDMTKATN